MNDLVKWGLIGGGAYFLYEWWIGQQQPTTTVSAPSSNVTPTGTVTTSSSPSTVTTTNGVFVERVAGAGASQPTASNPSNGRTLRGMGMIVDITGLDAGVPFGTDVSDGEFGLAGLGDLFMGHRMGSMSVAGVHGLGGIVDAPENNAAYIDEGPFVEAWAVNGGLNPSSQDFYLAAGLPINQPMLAGNGS